MWQGIFDKPQYNSNNNIDLSKIPFPETYHELGKNDEIIPYKYPQRDMQINIMIHYLCNGNYSNWNTVEEELGEVDFYRISGITKYNNALQHEFQQQYMNLLKQQ